MKAKSQQNKAVRVSIMAARTLRDIIKQAHNGDIAHLLNFDECVRLLSHGIPSGVINDAAAKEYARRVAYFVDGADNVKGYAFMSGRQPGSVKRRIRERNKALAFIAPKAERSEDEKAQALRKRNAAEQALSREKARIKKEIHAKNPRSKIDPDILKEKALAAIKVKREADSDKVRQEKARHRLLANLENIANDAKAGKFGDADARGFVERVAALRAIVNDLA